MIDGGVTAPQGFTAAGVAAGIKATGLDLAVLKADRPAAVAGTFTTNKVQAAPVKLCRTRIASGQAQAIVINSGSANACTGPQGMVDAEAMGATAAGALDVPEAAVLVCSTGTIGKLLPLDKIKPGIQAALFFIEHAAEEQDGGLGLFDGQIRIGDNEGCGGGLAVSFAMLSLPIGHRSLGGQVDVAVADGFAVQSLLTHQLS